MYLGKVSLNLLFATGKLSLNLLVMKKLLANASKYTYNKMAKTAYFWYYWGVSSVYFLKKQTKRALFQSLAISVVENEPTLE